MKTITKEQYVLLRNTFLSLKEAHKNKDISLLNYCCDIIEPFIIYKDFDEIQNHIIKSIGGL